MGGSVMRFESMTSEWGNAPDREDLVVLFDFCAAVFLRWFWARRRKRPGLAAGSRDRFVNGNGWYYGV
jgi:hypothetical protein